MKISSKLAGSECFYKIAVDSSDCRHGSNETLSFMFENSLDRDGDLALFNSLLGTADVNHVSESLHGIKLVALRFSTCLTDLKKKVHTSGHCDSFQPPRNCSSSPRPP